MGTSALPLEELEARDLQTTLEDEERYCSLRDPLAVMSTGPPLLLDPLLGPSGHPMPLPPLMGRMPLYDQTLLGIDTCQRTSDYV